MAKFVLSGGPESSSKSQGGYGGGGQRPGGGGFKQYPLIPEGKIVDAEIVAVEEREMPDWKIRNPEQTREISFRVKVLADPYKGKNLWGSTLPFFNYSPKCTFRLWVQACLGLDELSEGYELDLADLAGRRVRVLVGNSQRGKDYIQDIIAAKPFEDADDHF